GGGGTSDGPPTGGGGGTSDGPPAGGGGGTSDGPPTTCCDSTDITVEEARHRSVILQYVETLLEWSQALMRRNSPEAFQQARLILDTTVMILGKRPRTVLAEDSGPMQSVSNFIPLIPPLNPRLLEAYDHVQDSLGLIHACINAQRLRNGRLCTDSTYWGNSALFEGWKNTVDVCVQDAEWCALHSPYRFIFLVQKAQEIAGQVRELGAGLLAAFEKGDAEYLAALRAGHELELLSLARAIRQDQWREADWQRQALLKTKEAAQTNRSYYANLIANGLIGNETQYEQLMGISLVTRATSNIFEGVAEGLEPIPDMTLGAAGMASSPVSIFQIPIGSKLANMFKTIARITSSLAEIASATASMDLTQAGWDRRSQEWIHQVEVLDIEIEQMELQILAAERRCDQSLRELNSQQRQIEQSTEIQNFLRDKFTNHELYRFMQKETAALYYRLYELALRAAHQAERAFNFERGDTARKFVPCEGWDNLHEGLLAGERLQTALRCMEKEYLDLNVREYELMKHISLRLHFPMQFLQLKVTGYCEIEVPEWMLDMDYPGQYMRRIKNVSMTIPCVTGPYTGVHCRLTLLSSSTRIDPALSVPPHRCCHGRRGECYEACPQDPRVVRRYAAREAIATSSGQNDSGMFELSFRDERYLPFEFQGAVSRWRIELPQENNYFDIETLSDLVLHLNYTAREGGDLLRRAASRCAQEKLPGNGWCVFDIRHEFPDAWQLFHDACRRAKSEKKLRLDFKRRMFPFIPGHPDLWVTRMALLFEICEEEERCRHEIKDCPCPQKEKRTAYVVEFSADRDDRDEECEEIPFSCVAGEECQQLYHGAVDVRLGPLRSERVCLPAVFEFPCDIGEICRVYLLCRYQVRRECDAPLEGHLRVEREDSGVNSKFQLRQIGD
ncbi:MAG TPA: insecticidal toxin complex protein, partial [Verrucomicrobiae bacterium]|nr:insecticidal toxin complex protein [Verrucomicrobiae bacterium]